MFPSSTDAPKNIESNSSVNQNNDMGERGLGIISGPEWIAYCLHLASKFSEPSRVQFQLILLWPETSQQTETASGRAPVFILSLVAGIPLRGIPPALLGFVIFLGFSLETYFHCHDHQKVFVTWEFTELSSGFLMGP